MREHGPGRLRFMSITAQTRHSNGVGEEDSFLFHDYGIGRDEQGFQSQIARVGYFDTITNQAHALGEYVRLFLFLIVVPGQSVSFGLIVAPVVPGCTSFGTIFLSYVLWAVFEISSILPVAVQFLFASVAIRLVDGTATMCFVMR
jgi:hypothetical protein